MSLNFKPYISDCQDVPGFNNKFHTDELQKVCRNLPEGSKVLEIGVGWGCTSWAIMDSLPEGCEFYSCDTFGMNHPDLKQKHWEGVMSKHPFNMSIRQIMELYMETDQKTAYDSVINLHPRYNKLFKTSFINTSIDVLQHDNKWDMVYLDGLHSYQNVKMELAMCANVPVLCGDDYHPAHPGVVQAVDEFLLIGNQKREFWNDTRPKSGFWKAIRPSEV
jgi:hypothetical protein